MSSISRPGPGVPALPRSGKTGSRRPDACIRGQGQRSTSPSCCWISLRSTRARSKRGYRIRPLDELLKYTWTRSKRQFRSRGSGRLTCEPRSRRQHSRRWTGPQGFTADGCSRLQAASSIRERQIEVGTLFPCWQVVLGRVSPKRAPSRATNSLRSRRDAVPQMWYQTTVYRRNGDHDRTETGSAD